MTEGSKVLQYSFHKEGRVQHLSQIPPFRKGRWHDVVVTEGSKIVATPIARGRRQGVVVSVTNTSLCEREVLEFLS